MDRSTTLTAWLSRAAGATAVEPPVEEPVAIAATAELGEDAEDRRCAASVISGQRCRRPAVDGKRLCPGHVAMGTKAPAMSRAKR